MIKRDSELLTSANQIKNEAAAGANTAARVGGHLADMVGRLGRADIKNPDPNRDYMATVPVVTFKFDDISGDHSLWPTHFQAYSAARMAAGKHAHIANAPAIPGTLAFPSEYPKTTTPLITLSDLVFDATDVNGFYTIASATGGFADVIEPRMVISIVGTANNDAKFFVVYSVTDNLITTYPNYGGSTFANGTYCSAMVDETCATSVEIYRGKRNTSTWAQIKTAMDKGWTVAGHGRTHLNLGPRSNYPNPPSDADMWDEIYTSRQYLNATLSALMGTTVDVRHFVIPFGSNYDDTPTMLRQAGFLSANCYSYSGIDYEFVRGSYDPWHTDEENSHTLIDADNALTGTGEITAGGDTLTGTNTLFESELAEGDIIAVWNNQVQMYQGGVYQVRRVTAISSNTSLTVDSAWGANCTIASGATIYKCSDETAGDGLDIGNINYIAANNGWIQIAQHVPYADQDEFNRSVYAAIVDYIDYLNEDGECIQILDRDAAYEVHRPLLEAGTGFAVSHDGVMIRRAKSRNFTITDDGAIVLGAPISNYKVPDEDITPNRFTIYLNETGNKLVLRVKYSNGTIKTGEIALV